MDGLHVTRLPAQVHGYHHLGQGTFAFGEFELVRQCLRAQVVGARVDIDKVYLCAAVQGTVGGSDEGNRRCPQTVARAQPESQAGNVQGRGGAVDCQGVAGSDVLRDSLFEPRDHGPLGQEV
ncbi:hypothetical protein D3C80_1799150 [compost metagenome]